MFAYSDFRNAKSICIGFFDKYPISKAPLREQNLKIADNAVKYIDNGDSGVVEFVLRLF